MMRLLNVFFLFAVLIALSTEGVMAQSNPVFPKIKLIYQELSSGKTPKLTQLPQDKRLKHVRSYAFVATGKKGGGATSYSIIVSYEDSLKLLYINDEPIIGTKRQGEGDQYGFTFKPDGTLLEAGTSGPTKVFNEIDFSKKEYDQELYKKYLPDITFSIDEICNRILN